MKYGGSSRRETPVSGLITRQSLEHFITWWSKNEGEEEMEVKEFFQNGVWNVEKLSIFLPQHLIEHIVESIKPQVGMESNDEACWMGNSKGEFMASSTFNIMRHKKEKINWVRNIWIKGIPFKIAFFLWRV